MILFIIPLRDEEKTISNTANNVIDWCKKNLDEWKIFFIDDHSSDETYKKVLEFSLPSNIRVIKNQFDSGKGISLKFGFVLSSFSSSFNDKDFVVFLDGDGQISIDDLSVFIKLMEMYNADVVIGNKRHRYSITQYSFGRKLISLSFNFFVRMLFGFDYRDTQCGIKIFKKAALSSVIGKIRTKEYAFDVELMVAMREAGLRIVDSPVKILPQNNKGSVSIRNIIKTLMETLGIFYRQRKGFYRA